MAQLDYRPGRKRVKWTPGLIVAVPLQDGSWGLGQTAELMMPNWGYCALFSYRLNDLTAPVPPLSRQNLVALLAVGRRAVAQGYWPVLGSGPGQFLKAQFPNERLALSGYVGAKMYEHGLAEKLLSAYHGLMPWNIYTEEDYLDGLLAAGVQRPTTARVLGPEERAKYRSMVGLVSPNGAV